MCIPALEGGKIDGLRLGTNPEFKTRPFGLPGMAKQYGIEGVTLPAISDGGGPRRSRHCSTANAVSAQLANADLVDLNAKNQGSDKTASD